MGGFGSGRRFGKDTTNDYRTLDGADSFTARDIYRKQWHLLNDAEIVGEALNELVDAGWLLRDTQAAAWQQRGCVRYRVNAKMAKKTCDQICVDKSLIYLENSVSQIGKKSPSVIGSMPSGKKPRISTSTLRLSGIPAAFTCTTEALSRGFLLIALSRSSTM